MIYVLLVYVEHVYWKYSSIYNLFITYRNQTFSFYDIIYYNR